MRKIRNNLGGICAGAILLLSGAPVALAQDAGEDSLSQLDFDIQPVPDPRTEDDWMKEKKTGVRHEEQEVGSKLTPVQDGVKIKLLNTSDLLNEAAAPEQARQEPLKPE